MSGITAFANRWGGWAVLVLTLALCGVTGLVTPYLLVLVGAVLLIAQGLDGSLLRAWREPAAVSFTAVFVVLAICFAITAKRPGDVLLALNFVMLVLFAPFNAALTTQRREDGGRIVARLTLAGTLLSVVVALVMTVLSGGDRHDHGLIGVIVLSNTAVLLGFLSLLGLAAEARWWRWLYFIGPPAGIAVSLITHSRGPLLAVIPLAIVAAVFIVRTLRIHWALVTGALVLGIAGLGWQALQMGERMARIPHIFEDLLIGDVITGDKTADIRLDLYQAAWHAFLKAPIFGHGWAHMMQAAKPFLEQKRNAKLPQLHNDIADFAVSAGSIGVLCYAVLILTPIVAALMSPADRFKSIRIYGAFILATAYVFDGATDLMFGFEFHTALYAALSAILLGYCRERETRP